MFTAKIKVLGASLLFIVIYACLYYTLFQQEVEYYRIDAQTIFVEAIRQEKNLRMEEAKVRSSYGFGAPPSDSLTIISDNGKVEKVPRGERLNDVSADEFMDWADQTYLLIHRPLRITTLDSLFAAALQEQEVHLPTAITYTANDTTTHSHPDPTFYRSAHALPPIYTGVKGEITLQAFVQIPLTTVLGGNVGLFVLSPLLFALLLGGTGYAIRTMQRHKAASEPILRTEQTLIRVSEHVWFDRDKRTLYLHNNRTEVTLTGIQSKLFVALIESPNYFCSTEKLKSTAWENATTSQDALNTNITRLRNSLKAIPELTVAFEGGGYRLAIPATPPSNQNERS